MKHWRAWLGTALGLALALLAPTIAHAQVPLPGHPDIVLAGNGGEVFATAVQADGKVVIGGTFSFVNGVSRSNLARLNVDGSLDLTWAPNPDSDVFALAIIGTTLYVGGQYFHIGGLELSNLAAVELTTGNAIAGFAPQPSQRVTALASFGGTLLVGGYFNSIGGQSRHGAAAVNPATGAVTGWNPGPGSGVLTFAISGNSVYMGGEFQGFSRNYAAAYDATTGALLPWNPNVNFNVYALAANADVVFVGGIFAFVSGAYHPRLIATDPLTGAITSWPGTASGSVNSLVLSGNVLFVGGEIDGLGGITAHNIGAIDATSGVRLTAFNLGAMISSTVNAIAVSGSTVYLGGLFAQINGQARTGFAAVNTSGAVLNQPTHVAVSAGEVYAMTVQGDGKIVLGGRFTAAGNLRRTNLVRFFPDGSVDTSWLPEPNDIVYALASDAGTVYVAGEFSQIGGQGRSRLAGIDVATGLAIAFNPAPNDEVRAIAVSGNTVYVGGDFTQIAELPISRVAAINKATGASLSLFNPNANGTVEALAVVGSTLYLGGAFTNLSGQVRHQIGAVDANSGALLAWNPDSDGDVSSFAISGSTLFAAGGFGNIGGQSRSRIAGISTTTALATAFDAAPDGFVRSIAVSGNTVYAAGDFSKIGTQSRNNVAALVATTGVARAWNPNIAGLGGLVLGGGNVNAVAANGSAVYAAGRFFQTGTQITSDLVALPAAADRLAITSVNGGFNANVNYPFDVVVQSRDANNAPSPVLVSTVVTLIRTAGSGAVGTSVQCTIPVGSSTCTVVGATYNVGESSVQIGAFRLSGELVSPGTSASFNVLKWQSSIGISGTPVNITLGQSITINAFVSGLHGPATGTVTFFDGATTLGTSPIDASGNASFSTTSLAVGTHAITEGYSGDFQYLPATSGTFTPTVSKLPSTTTITATPNPANIGVPVTFTATVTGTAGTAVGTLIIKDGFLQIGSGVLNASGQFVFTTSSLSAGAHDITASYLADSDIHYNASVSGTLTQAINTGATPTIAIVSSVNPSNAGQVVTFTATVSGASGTPGGTVVFKDGGGFLGSSTLDAAGQAVYFTTALTKGSHAMTIVYSGSATYNGGTSPVLTQVVKAASATTLSYNPATVACGAQTTLTTTVTGSAGAPTGFVSIRAANGSQQGTGILNGSGVATTFLSFPNAGSNSFAADFPGDGNYGPSTSGLIPITVTSATTAVTLTSTANPAAAGASVKFTASVPAVGVCAAPTGSVTFKDGAATLGTGSLSGGIATFTTNGLSTGPHSITAQYAGNAFNSASTSAVLTFTVNVPGFALTVTRSGAGQGKVMSTPAGIDCGGTCTATFANGASVTLAPTPASGSLFGGWSGDCTGTGACQVTMGAAHGVSAIFTLDPLGDADGDGIPNGVEAAEGRNLLAKDNDVFAVNRLFVMQQYRDFLAREGDPAGIQGWVDLLNAGTYDRLQVIDAFLSSQEFSGFVAPVVRLYFATFLRVPDYDGLTFNSGLVRAGTLTVVQLADFFTQSPEFMATYGALNNTQFVTLLYNNVLGRAPDAGGLAGWVSLLQAGYTRGQVLVGFSESAEYQAAMANEVFVTMMYAGMLRRTPEPGGFNAWVGGLDALTYSRTQVINGFFLSTEYHARFLP
jgi:Domain of unknown function (DUF4214)/Bacterial Ig-like domain (group 3)/Domain of unknown function (DUF5122) beta-propeller/Divergent InlB B-repeat domain